MAGVVARMSDALAKIGGAQTGYRLSISSAVGDYGFQSSPSHWAVYRDLTIRKAQKEYRLEQTPEGNLWRILCKGGGTSGEVRPDGFQQVGLVAVYVDDLMVPAEPQGKQSFIEGLKKEWVDLLHTGRS